MDTLHENLRDYMKARQACWSVFFSIIIY